MTNENKGNSDRGWITVLLMAIVISLIVLAPVYVFMIAPMNDSVDQLIDQFHYHSIDYTEKINIESLRDSDQISGSFMLGSGYVGERPVYVYYIKNADGGYVRSQVYADTSTIYMDENVRPYIIKHFSETDKFHKRFESSYTIHVPNGTIITKYSVG